MIRTSFILSSDDFGSSLVFHSLIASCTNFFSSGIFFRDVFSRVSSGRFSMIMMSPLHFGITNTIVSTFNWMTTILFQRAIRAMNESIWVRVHILFSFVPVGLDFGLGSLVLSIFLVYNCFIGICTYLSLSTICFTDIILVFIFSFFSKLISDNFCLFLLFFDWTNIFHELFFLI